MARLSPGLFWKQKLSDKIFEPMLEKHGDANLALMVGDQIYADMFNRIIPIGLADTYEEFQERYHTAFSSPNMRALLSRLPTYMILDDHKIEVCLNGYAREAASAGASLS